MSRNTIAAAATATVAMWALAWSFPRDFSVGNFVDDAHYAVLAKSIRTQGMYSTINLPDSLPETKYPPGYPSLLALVWSPDRTDAENLDRIRWVNLVLVGPLAGLLTVLGIRMFGLSGALAAVVALAGVLSPRTAALWTIPMSGPAFLMAVTGGLLLVSRGRVGWGVAVLLMGVYVRTVAGAFVLGVVGWHLWTKDRRWKWELVAAVAAGLPWLAWQVANRTAVPDYMVGLYGSYGKWYALSLQADPVTMLFRVPPRNAQLAAYEIGANLVGRGWVWAPLGIALGVAALVLLVSFGRRHPSFLLGLGVYGIIVLLWPFPPDRFVAGIWPLLLVGIVAAAPGRGRWVVAALAAAVALVGVVRQEPVRYHRLRSEMSERIIARVDSTITGHDVLATTNPGLHYLRLGVPTVPDQRMRSYRWYRLGFWSTAWGLADDLWPIVERYRPSYLVIEVRGVEGRYTAGSLQGKCPDVLEKVWETPDRALLFRVNPDAPCAPQPAPR